jgi:hypothetical protein
VGKHQSLPQDDSNDNSCSLGRIGKHNIVNFLTAFWMDWYELPAEAASKMKSKFVLIQFGLMVGIAGGILSAASVIRLGDVVVSEPHMHSSE